jgi:uncharacterized protein YcsI (UPF0317 family)
MQDKFEWMLSQCHHEFQFAFAACFREKSLEWELYDKAPYIAAIVIGLVIGVSLVYRQRLSIAGLFMKIVRNPEPIAAVQTATAAQPIGSVQGGSDVVAPALKMSA